jgi:hypothetical protein
MSRGWWLACLVVLVLTTWPLALDPTGAILGSGGLEAVDHLWALWAALHDGPLQIQTDRVHWPDGYSWVLADPLNLPAFALGHGVAGPAFGFNLVQLCNLGVAAAGAVALGKVFLPPRLQAPGFTAVATLSLAPLAGELFTGMTEAQTLGWAALALAMMGQAMREGGAHRIVLAGILLGLCAWGGPYTAIYVALLGMPMALLLLAGSTSAGQATRRAGRLGTMGAIATALAAPVLWAVQTGRGDNLPGSMPLTEAIWSDPSLPQNRMLGADLVGLVLPIDAPGGAELHTAYLGGFFAMLALTGWARSRAHTLGIPAALATLLSLGFYLQLNGQIPLAGGHAWVAPAGWLTELLPDLGRAPRWYRMAGLAGMLFAPLAAAGAQDIALRLARRAGRTSRIQAAFLPGLALVVVADSLFVAPLSWPRDSFVATPPAAYAALTEPGALLELPSVRLTMQVAGRTMIQSGAGARTPTLPIRHPQLLHQTWHGRALGGNPHRAERRRSTREVTQLADALFHGARRGKLDAVHQARQRLAELGFAYLVHAPRSEGELEDLTEALGEPLVKSPRLVAWPVQAGR